jgi:ribonuclease III
VSGSLDKFCARLGYDFRNPDLLDNALTHRSRGNRNNERLEFLGDAVLGLCISETLYERFPEVEEGDLSRLRASLVNRDTLADVAAGLDFGDLLRLGSGELKSGGFRRRSIQADALEAIFGAVYLDGGFDAARGAINRLFEGLFDGLPPPQHLKDPKTRLQELLQAGRTVQGGAS